MNKFKKYLFATIFLFALVGAGWLTLQFKNKPVMDPVSSAVPHEEIAAPPAQKEVIVAPLNQVSEEVEIVATLPAEVNLKIPFIEQAPKKNWDLPYKEFCEETASLMASSYINNQAILNSSDADKKLLAIRDFEIKKFGFYADTNASETAIILREHFSLTKVEIVSNPTEMDIKNALAQGKAVIAPLAGRELGNPYYKQPGPLYHMVVIKGYQKNGDFITNDPGTRRGADFIYKVDVIMSALHDWNNGDVNTGEKVILVVG